MAFNQCCKSRPSRLQIASQPLGPLENPKIGGKSRLAD